MADPVSSVAYAIEAALRRCTGTSGLLLPAMGLVVAIIALVIVNYHQLVAPVPGGRRRGRGGGQGVRRGVGVRADRRADRRLRADDRDQRRGRRIGADRLPSGRCAGADPARAGAAGARRRADLVRSFRPGDLRRDDARVRRRPASPCWSAACSAPVANVGRDHRTRAGTPRRSRCCSRSRWRWRSPPGSRRRRRRSPSSGSSIRRAGGGSAASRCG